MSSIKTANKSDLTHESRSRLFIPNVLKAFHRFQLLGHRAIPDVNKPRIKPLFFFKTGIRNDL